MIVEQVERKVVTSIDMMSRRFRIDESGLVNILTILRKNMYANPTRIIVQEYANNARDAHVEAGIPERPIQITCPTSISPYLRIRDFGKGISPDQIDNVFVSYGASTKRHTNNLVGGFGLGAKSAFSYCDAFEVTTIHEGVKYIYSPYIDASDIGEMPLISVEETDEESGTLISIHIKDEDIYAVNNAITLVTEYWNIRPKLIGNLNYSNRKVYFREDNWALMEKSYSWYNDEIIYAVEGIPYTFKIPSGDDRFTEELKELAKCTFLVKLKTGDVTIASNREALVSDEKTLNKIHEILLEINDHFRSHVMESIENCDSLGEMFEMRAMYNRLRLDHMIRNFVWKGIQISGAHLSIPADVGTVHRIKLNKRGNDESRGYGIKCTATGENIDFSSQTSKFIFTTTVEEGKSYNKNQLLNAMLDDRHLTECQLIVLKVPADDPILETIGFQYFEKTSLSTYSKKNTWRAKKFGGKSPKVEYYVFTSPSDKPTLNWKRESGEVCDLEEGVYFPLQRGKIDLPKEFFSEFKQACTLPIYGIPPKSMEDAEENPNLIEYKEYLNLHCDKLSKHIEENQEDASSVYGEYNDKFHYNFDRIYNFTNKLAHDHLINKWKNISLKLDEPKMKEIKRIVNRYNLFALYLGKEKYQPTNSLKEIHELVSKTYPMLIAFEKGKYYYEGDISHYLDTVESYINSVDAQIALKSEN